MDDSLPELGDLEREVMQLVWANGPVTAEAVRERLSRPLKESTVRTVLRRLEDKGYTTHTVDGRTYVYQAAEPRARVAAKAVQRIVDWFCNGSVEEVLVGMVDTAMLDQRQLRSLADQVAKAKTKTEAKTKALVANFEKLGLTNALMIGGADLDQNFKRAASNIPNIDVLPIQGINVYDILRRGTLVLSKAAVEALEERFK